MHQRPLGVLATVGADGLPRAVPVEIVVHDGRVYSWCHATSVKARNAARNGAATFLVYKGNDWVMVRGRARVFGADDPSYEQVTQMFLRKYDRTETYGNDVLVEVQADEVASRLH